MLSMRVWGFKNFRLWGLEGRWAFGRLDGGQTLTAAALGLAGLKVSSLAKHKGA